MDLTLVCREKVSGTWIFHVRSGQALQKQEWTELVEQHIKAKEQNKEEFEKIENTVKLWNENDNRHEIALIVYASKYCTNVSQEITPQKISYRVVKDSMANAYEQSIITVIDEFNKALCESKDVDNAKLKTICVLGKLRRGEV